MPPMTPNLTHPAATKLSVRLQKDHHLPNLSTKPSATTLGGDLCLHPVSLSLASYGIYHVLSWVAMKVDAMMVGCPIPFDSDSCQRPMFLTMDGFEKKHVPATVTVPLPAIFLGEQGLNMFSESLH